MDVDAVKALCGRHPGSVSKTYGPPSNVLVYYVGGRKFAYFKTSEPERWRFSVRASPDRFLELTDVPGIKPARYLARFRWVTIVDVETVPSDYLRELIAWSYAKALSTLSRRQRLALTRAASGNEASPAPARGSARSRLLLRRMTEGEMRSTPRCSRMPGACRDRRGCRPASTRHAIVAPDEACGAGIRCCDVALWPHRPADPSNARTP